MAELDSILVVDDDEASLMLCVDALEGESFAVKSANRGAQAMKMIEAGSFDIVLTDLYMAAPDGREILRRVKDLRPETDVVVMTGSPSLDSAIEAVQEGAYDYLIKPFKPLYLKTVLNRCFEKRRARKELAVEKGLREDLMAAYSELEKLQRVKESFIARISHELRTPLSEVMVSLNLLNDTLAGSDKKRLDIAVHGAHRLEGVIMDLLSFVDVQKPDPALKCSTVNLSALLGAIGESIKGRLEAKKLRLSIDLEKGLPGFSGDKELLERALRHIMLNAILFNREGGEVKVRGRLSGEDILVTVEDTGEGIVPEQLGIIFDPFYQIAGYMTRRVGGMGLGLALARRIAVAHGGNIEARSTPGKGSAFVVRLPLKPSV